MFTADMIEMQSGYEKSDNPNEIDKIHIITPNNTPFWFSKEDLHDYIKNNHWIVKVNISPYPVLIPAISPAGEKYVKSAPNSIMEDNLMNLPRKSK